MTAGHKHRELKLRRDSLLNRILTHPLVFSDDLDRVDRSPYPWGPIAGPSDPVPLMPDGQPAPKHLTWHSTPPGSWYMSALSILHRWTGLTIRIPDDEVDQPETERIERIMDAMVAKQLAAVEYGVDLEGAVRTTVADVWLILRGDLSVEDFERKG